MNDHYQEIVKDISLLYELSLSIGTSLDLKENCDAFLNKLLARENFAFASVWIKNKYLTGEHNHKATLVYANPEYRACENTIDISSPAFTLIKDKEPVMIGNEDDHFEMLIAEKDINKGIYFIFPLGDIGFLKVYSAFEKKTGDDIILSKLINVVSKFTVSVEACLYHERALREIEERRRIENELRISEKRFKDMAELLPEMIYECDLRGDFTYINKSGLQMLGFSKEDLHRGLNISELIPDSEKGKFRSRFTELLAAKELPSMEYELLTKHGSMISVIMSSTVMIKGREVTGIRGIALDITEKKRMQDSLLDAKMIAVANRARNDFFANMSHELRTPLNSIIGFSNVLEDRTYGELNEEQARYVDYIHSSGQKLLELINDLLSLSMMETQDIEIKPEYFDIIRAVVEVSEALKPLLLRRNVHMEVITHTEIGTIHADRSKFKQIVYNLINCILNKSEERLDMDLELDMVSNMLKVSIKQKQNIFSSDDIEKITGILSENNKGSSGENDALELEMMLTKRFVELHDGSIWFESCGEGSCFSFILPADTKVENESQLILV